MSLERNPLNNEAANSLSQEKKLDTQATPGGSTHHIMQMVNSNAQIHGHDETLNNSLREFVYKYPNTFIRAVQIMYQDFGSQNKLQSKPVSTSNNAAIEEKEMPRPLRRGL